MQKIVVIRLSALGDVIFALPAVEGLARRWPDAAITWIVEDKAATILEGRRELDRIIVFPRRRLRKLWPNPLKWPALILLLLRYFREIRREKYDILYDFQGNLKSGIHTLIARSRKKVGFSRAHVKEMSHLFYGEKRTPPPQAIHRMEKFFSLPFPDFRKEEILPPDLQVKDEILERAASDVEQLLPGGSSIAVLHPGTSQFGAFKRWPALRFGSLARRLHAERGIRSLVTWGPGEKELAEEAAAASEGCAVVAPETRSLQELFGLIAQGKLFVAADSGPLHMANCLGIPCVALFGPKDPALYSPYFQPAVVGRRDDKDCTPCNRRECDDPICMTGLDVEPVLQAALKMLDSE